MCDKEKKNLEGQEREGTDPVSGRQRKRLKKEFFS